MIKIFNQNECDNIVANGITNAIEDKLIGIMRDYLLSNNLVLTNNSAIKVVTNKSATTRAHEWHFDDVSIINFIVCIEGPGTEIYEPGSNQITCLTPGHGYMVIGEEGYEFLNLIPTFHKAPANTGVPRLMTKVFLSPNFNSDESFIGNVNKYNSEGFLSNRQKITKLKESYMKNILQMNGQK